MLTLFGIPLHPYRRSDILARIQNILHEPPHLHTIATVGPEFLLRTRINTHFKTILTRSWINTVDGAGIRWAAYFLAQSYTTTLSLYWHLCSSLVGFFFNQKKFRSIIPEQITGADLLDDIIRIAAQEKKRVFLVGGAQQASERAAKFFQSRYPTLSISGISGPFFSINNIGSAQFSRINEVFLENMRTFPPDIVIVGFGSPKQEFWIDAYCRSFPKITLAVGVGMGIEYAAGVKKRAPHLLRKTLNLEWLWRLCMEPKRVIRIWSAVGIFIAAIFAEKLRSLPQKKNR